MKMYYCNFGKLPPEIHPVDVMKVEPERVWFTLVRSYPRFAANEGYYGSEKEALDAWVKFLNEETQRYQVYIRRTEETLAHYYPDVDADKTWEQRLKDVLPEQYATLAIDRIVRYWNVVFDSLRVKNLSAKEMVTAITCMPFGEPEKLFWQRVSIFLQRPENSAYRGTLPPLKTECVCNECNAVHGVKNTTEQDIADGLVSCIDCGCPEFHIVHSIPNENI